MGQLIMLLCHVGYTKIVECKLTLSRHNFAAFSGEIFCLMLFE